MRVLPAAIALSSLAACTGLISDPHAAAGEGPTLPPETVPATCADELPMLAPSPLVRLSRDEYRNTIADLFGEPRPEVVLPADEVNGLFRANAVAPVSRLHVETYAEAASAIALSVDVDSLLSCDADADPFVCLTAFVDRFAPRVYRRPLTEAERALTDALIDAALGEAALEEATRLVVEALLQSPQFLYRIEDVDPAGTRALSDHELASRLSYFLWDTMPDEALLAAAEAGELSDAASLEAHARRMIDSPRALPVMVDFHLSWLGLTDIESIDKDPDLFPEWDESLRASMVTETELLLTHLLRSGDGRLSTLLTTEESIVDERLAALYGAERIDPAESSLLTPEDAEALPPGFFPARMPAGERAGIFTQASVLSTLAKHNQTAPVSRGAFVLERILCVELGQPPPSVMADPPEPDPSLTAREQYRQHSEDPACSGCHQLIDPVGFSFESYDAIGRYRTVDPGGHPVDASGHIALEEGELAFEGAVELAAAIGDGPEAADCFSRQWFRYALSRNEDEAEACLMDDLRGALVDSGGDIRELVIAVVRSPAFRFAAPD